MPKKLADLDVATEVNDDDLLYLEQGGTAKQLPVSAFWVPTNYIGGLITSNDSGDADHDIAIAPGIARSDDDSASLRLDSILTKQIDAAWALGDDAGGLDAGTVAADELYALWLIKRSDTGVVDALFMRHASLTEVITVDADTTDDSYNDSGSGLDIFEPGQTVRVVGFTDPANNGLKTVVSSTAAKLVVSENLVTEAAGDTVTLYTVAPALPTNYDLKRLIAAVITDASANITQYIQSDNLFTLLPTDYVEFDDPSVGSTPLTARIHVPPLCQAHIAVEVDATTAAQNRIEMQIRPKGMASVQTPSATWVDAGSDVLVIRHTMSVLVSEVSQIQYSVAINSGSLDAFTVQTEGFTMLTRSSP